MFVLAIAGTLAIGGSRAMPGNTDPMRGVTGAQRRGTRHGRIRAQSPPIGGRLVVLVFGLVSADRWRDMSGA
jgi:hypothetical protein